MGTTIADSLLKPIHQFVKAWDKFWFTPADPFNACVIRLLAGWMIVYTHIIWGTHLTEFFGDDGWNSRAYLSQMQEGTFTWSFWWYIPDAWKQPVHWGCMLILVCFFLGLWTRTTSVLTWLIAVAYSTRSALSNYGLDQINCILLMYLMLAPCGHYLSIDAWLRRRKGRPDPAPSALANVSMRLIQLHLCVIYLWAGLGKLQGEAWWDGRAIWQALASYEYQSTDLTFLAAYPAILNVLTHMTIAWEVFFPALVCNRVLRPFALLLGVGMHLGIGAFLGMWTFGTAMTFGYLAFVPSNRLRQLISLILRRPQMVSSPSDTQPTAAAQPVEPLGVLAASTWVARPAEATAALIPFRGNVPNVVLVARGATNRKRLTKYLESHAVRLLIVDGLTEAGALAHVNPETVIVVVDSRSIESELNVLCQWIRHQNPQTRFVFVGQSPNYRNDDPGTVIVERNCSLRQIRTAIEELTGCTCEERPNSADRLSSTTPPSAMDATDTMDPLDEIVADHSSDHATACPSLTRVMPWLLLTCIFFASGCQQEPSAALLLERVRLLNDNNQKDEALSVISEILQREPGHPDALYQRGVAYEQNNQYQEAIDAYTECLKNAPDFAEALNNRGIVYGLLGKTDKSLDDIKAATLAKPDVSLFWANLGLVQCKLGQFDQALESYQRAQYQNEDIRLELQKGNVLTAAARFSEAIAAYSRVLEKDKKNTMAWLNRANARFQLGQGELASEDLGSAENCDTEFTYAPHIVALRTAIKNDDEHSGQE